MPYKPRQHRRGDDFLDGAEHRLAVAEIEHAVERAEQLVEFVRAEQHGDLALAADLAHHVDRDFLVARIEADQRLVEQQQFRFADQRLRQQQPLPLAAGHVGQRAPRQIARADRVERFFDHAAVARG